MSSDNAEKELIRGEESESDTEPLDTEAPIVPQDDNTVDNQVDEFDDTEELDSWDADKTSDSKDAILTLSPESQRTNCADSEEILSSEEVGKNKEIHIVEQEIDMEEDDTSSSEEDSEDIHIQLPYPEHVYAPLWQNYSDFVVLPYLHSSTVLETPEGEKPISTLKDGDVLLDSEGKEVILKKIFKVQPKLDFIRFGTGSLQCKEPNKEPSYDL